MSTPMDRIAVFEDTMDWIDSDPDLIASIPAAKQNTTVFYENDYPVFDAGKIRKMTVTVTGNRSYQAAMALHKDNPNAKIAVMNFANAFHPGGGSKERSWSSRGMSL